MSTITTSRAPLISIGMPAYNSARTIRSALDCLLAQDCTDFEIIVSDNASTDDTWSILQEYAARDPRIVTLRQRQNIGANGNYTAVFRAARGRYFKWASSNDLCAPNFVSACIAMLAAHPDAVLVAPRTRLFHDTFEQGTDYEEDRAFDDADPVRRFADVTTCLRLNNVLNGVVRSDALKRTRLIEHYRGADVVLLGHLAMLGRILLLEQHLFGRRMDRKTATPLMTNEEIGLHHHPHKTTRALFPGIRYTIGCLQAVLATDLSTMDKLRALGWVARLTRWRGAEIGRDLVDALRYPLR